jgi:hypothetical protein
MNAGLKLVLKEIRPWHHLLYYYVLVLEKVGIWIDNAIYVIENAKRELP